MTTASLFEFINAIPDQEFEEEPLTEVARKKSKIPPFSEPIAGHGIVKHLNRSQIKSIMSDEHYIKHVANDRHIAVFRIQQWKPTLKRVRVGNTAGEGFVEFHVSNHGTIHNKHVFSKVKGPHTGQWAKTESWSLADELKKGKKK